MDTTNFGAYARQGIVEDIKVPSKISFHSLAESRKNPAASAVDGFANSMGYSVVLIYVALFRELFGSGMVLGYPVFTQVKDGGWYEPNVLMTLSPGAFFLIGFLIWVQRSLTPKLQEAD